MANPFNSTLRVAKRPFGAVSKLGAAGGSCLAPLPPPLPNVPASGAPGTARGPAARRPGRLASLGACLFGACSLLPSAGLANSMYAQWPNGPPQNPNFIPITVWWQNPALAGKSGSYPTEAAAAAG